MEEVKRGVLERLEKLRKRGLVDEEEHGLIVKFVEGLVRRGEVGKLRAVEKLLELHEAGEPGPEEFHERMNEVLANLQLLVGKGVKLSRRSLATVPVRVGERPMPEAVHLEVPLLPRVEYGGTGGRLTMRFDEVVRRSEELRKIGEAALVLRTLAELALNRPVFFEPLLEIESGPGGTGYAVKHTIPDIHTLLLTYGTRLGVKDFEWHASLLVSEPLVKTYEALKKKNVHAAEMYLDDIAHRLARYLKALKRETARGTVQTALDNVRAHGLVELREGESREESLVRYEFFTKLFERVKELLEEG